MLPTTLLLSLSLLGLTSALPASTVPTEHDSLAVLVSRGIDPTGPIPGDAVPLPSGGYSFDSDSDTAHWVRAQTTLPLSKRALSGLSVSMWTGDGCNGSGAVFPNVQYGDSMVGPLNFYATVNFPGRALLSNEQMDIARLTVGNSDKCGGLVQTFQGGTPAGCKMTKDKQFSCVRLKKN